MGKLLIIQGADFSENAVDFQELNWSYLCGFIPTVGFTTNASSSYYFANNCTDFEEKYVNKIELIFTDSIQPTLNSEISVSVKRNEEFIVLDSHVVSNDDITNKKVTLEFNNILMGVNELFYFHSTEGYVGGYSQGSTISPAQKLTEIVNVSGVVQNTYTNLPIGVNYYGRI